MGLLVLVRHGQASALSEGNYDQLSPLGEKQATQLGEHLLAENLVARQVFVGPARRHQQTHDAVAKVFRAGGRIWPEPVRVDGLDEHQGIRVINLAFTAEHAQDAELAKLIRDAHAPEADRRTLARASAAVLRAWAKGDFKPAIEEPLDRFRVRVEQALESMRASASESDQPGAVLAFTSGGVVAAAVGQALSLSDELTMELSLAIDNASLTELLFSSSERGRFSLKRFNGVSHLEREQITNL
jgi:broad specificity phosphatase PhoE